MTRDPVTICRSEEQSTTCCCPRDFCPALVADLVAVGMNASRGHSCSAGPSFLHFLVTTNRWAFVRLRNNDGFLRVLFGRVSLASICLGAFIRVRRSIRTVWTRLIARRVPAARGACWAGVGVRPASFGAGHKRRRRRIRLRIRSRCRRRRRRARSVTVDGVRTFIRIVRSVRTTRAGAIRRRVVTTHGTSWAGVGIRPRIDPANGVCWPGWLRRRCWCWRRVWRRRRRAVITDRYPRASCGVTPFVGGGHALLLSMANFAASTASIAIRI